MTPFNLMNKKRDSGYQKIFNYDGIINQKPSGYKHKVDKPTEQKHRQENDRLQRRVAEPIGHKL